MPSSSKPILLLNSDVQGLAQVRSHFQALFAEQPQLLAEETQAASNQLNKIRRQKVNFARKLQVNSTLSLNMQQQQSRSGAQQVSARVEEIITTRPQLKIGAQEKLYGKDEYQSLLAKASDSLDDDRLIGTLALIENLVINTGINFRGKVALTKIAESALAEILDPKDPNFVHEFNYGLVLNNLPSGFFIDELSSPGELILAYSAQLKQDAPNNNPLAIVKQPQEEPAPILASKTLADFNDLSPELRTRLEAELAKNLCIINAPSWSKILSQYGPEALYKLILNLQVLAKKNRLSFISEKILGRDDYAFLASPTSDETLTYLANLSQLEFEWWQDLMDQHLKHHQHFDLNLLTKAWHYFCSELKKLKLKLPPERFLQNIEHLQLALDRALVILKTADNPEVQLSYMSGLNFSAGGEAQFMQYGGYKIVTKKMNLLQDDGLDVQKYLAETPEIELKFEQAESYFLRAIGKNSRFVEYASIPKAVINLSGIKNKTKIELISIFERLFLNDQNIEPIKVIEVLGIIFCLCHAKGEDNIINLLKLPLANFSELKILLEFAGNIDNFYLVAETTNKYFRHDKIRKISNKYSILETYNKIASRDNNFLHMDVIQVLSLIGLVVDLIDRQNLAANEIEELILQANLLLLSDLYNQDFLVCLQDLRTNFSRLRPDLRHQTFMIMSELDLQRSAPYSRSNLSVDCRFLALSLAKLENHSRDAIAKEISVYCDGIAIQGCHLEPRDEIIYKIKFGLLQVPDLEGFIEKAHEILTDINKGNIEKAIALITALLSEYKDYLEDETFAELMKYLTGQDDEANNKVVSKGALSRLKEKVTDVAVSAGRALVFKCIGSENVNRILHGSLDKISEAKKILNADQVDFQALLKLIAEFEEIGLKFKTDATVIYPQLTRIVKKIIKQNEDERLIPFFNKSIEDRSLFFGFILMMLNKFFTQKLEYFFSNIYGFNREIKDIYFKYVLPDIQNSDLKKILEGSLQRYDQIAELLTLLLAKQHVSSDNWMCIHIANMVAEVSLRNPAQLDLDLHLRLVRSIIDFSGVIFLELYKFLGKKLESVKDPEIIRAAIDSMDEILKYPNLELASKQELALNAFKYLLDKNDSRAKFPFNSLIDFKSVLDRFNFSDLVKNEIYRKLEKIILDPTIDGNFARDFVGKIERYLVNVVGLENSSAAISYLNLLLLKLVQALDSREKIDLVIAGEILETIIISNKYAAKLCPVLNNILSSQAWQTQVEEAKALHECYQQNPQLAQKLESLYTGNKIPEISLSELAKKNITEIEQFAHKFEQDPFNKYSSEAIQAQFAPEKVEELKLGLRNLSERSALDPAKADLIAKQTKDVLAKIQAYHTGDHSRAELKARFLALKVKRLSDPEDAEAFVEIVAILSEILFRTMGKYPYPTQIMSLLTAFHFPQNLLLQLNTGEGKSIATALMAVIEWTKGRTVDVCSANSDLIRRDFNEFYDFYNFLEIPCNQIGANSEPEDYVIGGLNYSTPGELSLFRTWTRIKGGSVRHRPGSREKLKQSLIIDEVDGALLDDRTSFDASYQIDGDIINDLAWIYPLIMQFLSEPKAIKIDAAAWNKEADLLELQKFILTQVNGDPVKTRQLSLIPEARWDKWLDSAFLALRYQAGREFVIIEDAAGTGHIVPLLEQIPQPGSVFSNGLQNLLCAKLKAENPAKTYYAAPESAVINSEVAKAFVDYYLLHSGRLIGMSATPGIDLELLEQRDKFGVEAISIPPYQSSRRTDHGTEIAQNHEDLLAKLIDMINSSEVGNDSTEGRAPILIICEDANAVKELARDLSNKLPNFSCNTVCGDEDENERRRIVEEEAGKVGQITIATTLLGRGTDIKTTHPEGLFLIKTNLTTERVETQILGRTARNGRPGQVKRIYDAKKIATQHNIELLDLQDATQVDQKIAQIQQRMAKEAAIERHYVQEQDKICGLVLKQFHKWSRLILSNNDPVKYQGLMLLRKKLLEELQKKWHDLLDETDLENQLSNLYVKYDENGNLITEHLNQCLELFSAAAVEIWDECQNKLITQYLSQEQKESARFRYLTSLPFAIKMKYREFFNGVRFEPENRNLGETVLVPPSISYPAMQQGALDSLRNSLSWSKKWYAIFAKKVVRNSAKEILQKLNDNVAVTPDLYISLYHDLEKLAAIKPARFAIRQRVTTSALRQALAAIDQQIKPNQDLGREIAQKISEYYVTKINLLILTKFQNNSTSVDSVLEKLAQYKKHIAIWDEIILDLAQLAQSSEHPTIVSEIQAICENAQKELDLHTGLPEQFDKVQLYRAQLAAAADVNNNYQIAQCSDGVRKWFAIHQHDQNPDPATELDGAIADLLVPLEASYAEVKKEQNSLQARIKDLSDGLNEISDNVKELEAQLQKDREELARLRSEYEQLTKTIGRDESEVQALKKETYFWNKKDKEAERDRKVSEITARIEKNKQSHSFESDHIISLDAKIRLIETLIPTEQTKIDVNKRELRSLLAEDLSLDRKLRQLERDGELLKQKQDKLLGVKNKILATRQNKVDKCQTLTELYETKQRILARRQERVSAQVGISVTVRT